MTAESRDESLRFKKWGTIKHRDVPFDIVNPQRTATGNNVIVLQGGAGMSRNYPRQVEVKVGLPATKLHFLGGVGGWGFPLGLTYDTLFLLPMNKRLARREVSDDAALQAVARVGRSRLLVRLARALFAVDRLFSFIPFGPGLVMVARKPD